MPLQRWPVQRPRHVISGRIQSLRVTKRAPRPQTTRPRAAQCSRPVRTAGPPYRIGLAARDATARAKMGADARLGLQRPSSSQKFPLIAIAGSDSHYTSGEPVKTWGVRPESSAPAPSRYCATAGALTHYRMVGFGDQLSGHAASIAAAPVATSASPFTIAVAWVQNSPAPTSAGIRSEPSKRAHFGVPA